MKGRGGMAGITPGKGTVHFKPTAHNDGVRCVPFHERSDQRLVRGVPRRQPQPLGRPHRGVAHEQQRRSCRAHSRCARQAMMRACVSQIKLCSGSWSWQHAARWDSQAGVPSDDPSEDGGPCTRWRLSQSGRGTLEKNKPAWFRSPAAISTASPTPDTVVGLRPKTGGGAPLASARRSQANPTRSSRPRRLTYNRGSGCKLGWQGQGRRQG